MRLSALVLIAAVVACGGATSGTPSPTGSPAAGALSQAQLKYRIVDRFGVLAFCDPDYSPLVRAEEQALAHQRLPDIEKDAATIGAILVHLGIGTGRTYTSAEELAIYREWKMLNALRLDQVSAGFRFTGVFVGSGNPSTSAVARVDGTIDQAGTITVATQTPSGRPACPICLARGTRIATPRGEVAIEDLRPGDLVWTLDSPGGSRVALPLVAIGSTPVPATHRLVELRLSDGRVVEASPGHPTADGRAVGELAAGDRYDGSVVASTEQRPYSGGATFDVLPAGATGTYWADGVLLKSTISASDPRRPGPRT